MKASRRVPAFRLTAIAAVLFWVASPADGMTAAATAEHSASVGSVSSHVTPLATGQPTAKYATFSRRTLIQTSGNADVTLMAAARDGDLEEVVKAVDEGANIDARDADGFTPLMWASTNGRMDVVQFLLDNMADINATSIQGYSSLSEASFAGYADIVSLLITAGAYINQADRDGYTSLHLAVKEAKLDVATVLIKNGINMEAQSARTGASALLLAAEIGRTFMFRELVRLGANVSAVDFNGATAFHYASESEDWEQIMGILLDAGADVNATDNSGNSVLEYAAWVGNLDAVRWLLSIGADPSVVDDKGKTAAEELCGCEDAALFSLPCFPGSCRNTTAENEVRKLLGGEIVVSEEPSDPCANLPPPDNVQCYMRLNSG